MLETILNSILPNILEIVLTIISFVVSCYVIPYIKGDLIPSLKEKRIYNVVKNFVQAVEKMAEAGIIPKTDKKKKVVELLESKNISVNVEVEAVIESCVKELDIITSTIYKEIVSE